MWSRDARPFGLFHFIGLVILSGGSASAQVKEVVIGLTPTCPYGRCGCWSAAPEALKRMEIGDVSEYPDVYNWTVLIHPKEGQLPDEEKIRRDFKKIANDAYIFRGIEVTALGTVAKQEHDWVLELPDTTERVTLAPLAHKLQWNIQKHAARGPEPDEKEAYQQLADLASKASDPRLRVLVTGPLLKTPAGYMLEVREFVDFQPVTGKPKVIAD